MDGYDIFSGLNDRQRKAVETTEGTVRVIAGAGTGKTRVLTQRYIYLVNELGINPSNILCMTFTNKAAQEMKQRIMQVVDSSAVNDLVCTIHSFCLKVLRRDIYRMGFPKSFAVLDEDDQKAIARQVFEDFGITRQQHTLDQFVKGMTAYKANNKTAYILRYMLPGSKPDPLESKTADYLAHQLRLMALDFNDIIHFAVYLLQTYPDVRRHWQDQLNYVMMDEGQDCNENDWLLMQILTEKSGNLFVVGDPDQAIYEWRGAVPKLFIDFKAAHDIVLDKNYRSTPNILGAANSVIDHNVNRIKKRLFPTRESGVQVAHFHAKTEKKEAAWIAARIKELSAQGAHFSDFAVLYRSSFLSRNIEQALMKANLPYSIWGGIRFFERREIKDAIAYLRLIATGDDLSFLRIINVPSRKLGKVFMEELKASAKAEHASLYDTLKRHTGNGGTLDRPAARDFVALIEEFRQRMQQSSVSDLLELVLRRSGLMKLVRTDGDEDRLENVAELQASVKLYEQENRNEDISLHTYLQDIALYTNLDTDLRRDSVKLMTVHQSKGLEFPYVFVTGLSEGIFPNARTLRERKHDGDEEERRLMYVAATRAERALFLTESEGYSSSAQSDKFPSRYLLEIKRDFLVVEGKIEPRLLEGTRAAMIGATASPAAVATAGSTEFKEGDRVKHRVFGTGTVRRVKADGSCDVDFNGAMRCIMPTKLLPA